MAGTCTVPKLADGIENLRGLHLLVIIGLVVISMATCTIRFIGTAGPRGGLGVTLVAIDTHNAGVVVARIVRR